MDIPSEVRRIVQQYLVERGEDNAILRGPKDDEYHRAYLRLLNRVFKTMQDRLNKEWTEWVKIQGEVQQAVNQCCEELRRW